MNSGRAKVPTPSTEWQFAIVSAGIVLAVSYAYYRYCYVSIDRSEQKREKKNVPNENNVRAKREDTYRLDNNLRVAVWKQDAKRVRSLLLQGADPTRKDFLFGGNTLLHVAAALGNLEIFMQLRSVISSSSVKQVNAKNDHGDTADDIIGTKPVSKNSDTSTPKDRSAIVNEFEKAALLFECSEAVEPSVMFLRYLVCDRECVIEGVKTANGSTVLHEAARRCSSDVVRLLLDRAKEKNAKSIDVGIQNSAGRTALHVAALRSCNESEDPKECRDIVKVLADAMSAAQLSIQDESGQTALHLAKSADSLVVELLLKKLPRKTIKLKDASGNTARELTILSDPTMDVEIYE